MSQGGFILKPRKGNLKLIFARLTIGFLASILVFITVTQAASVTDLENQRDTLSRNAARAQTQADVAKQKVSSLSDQIDSLNQDIANSQSKISDLNSQISSTQASISDLNTQIEQTNKDLVVQENNQNSALATIYETTGQSPLALLGGGNISDAVDQDAYLEALETSIESTMKHINDLKASLDSQRNDLNSKQKSLSDAKQSLVDLQGSLVAQKNQQTQLKNLTADQAASYEAQAKSLQAEATKVSSQIYALRAQQSGSISGTGLGYPYSSIDAPDPWGFLTRECTSYVAWYWNVVLGKSFVRGGGPTGTGNATNFPTLARNQGYSVSSTPRVGAIISWSSSYLMPYGHVAIVQAVNGDGTINVSEYNWIQYSGDQRSNVSPSKYGSYSYIY